jgi:hypothetical protein
MTRRVREIAFSGLLFPVLATACDHGPKVILPQGTYALPKERAAGESSPAASEETPQKKPPFAQSQPVRGPDRR